MVKILNIQIAMSGEEESHPSKLSVFRTSQLWSRRDEPGGDWTLGLGAVEDIFCEWLE